MKQTYTSAATSINAGRVPAVFKLVSWAPGGVNVDIGGGRYDTAAEYLAPHGVENVVIDPYNRTPAENDAARQYMRAIGGADTATVSNVLNVINDADARRAVLEQARSYTRPGARVYITVYEGDGSGRGRQTGADSWQENRRTVDYVDEVRRVFPYVRKRGRVIEAVNGIPAGGIW